MPSLDISPLLLEEKHSGMRIFENFYIIGCKNKDFVEFDQDEKIEEGIVPA